MCVHMGLAVQVMDTLISRHATRLLKLRVDEIEVKARISMEQEGRGSVSTRVLDCCVLCVSDIKCHVIGFRALHALELDNFNYYSHCMYRLMSIVITHMDNPEVDERYWPKHSSI